MIFILMNAADVFMKHIRKEEVIQETKERLNLSEKDARYYLSATYIQGHMKDCGCSTLYEFADNLIKNINEENLRKFVEQLEVWKSDDKVEHIEDIHMMKDCIDHQHSLCIDDENLEAGYILQLKILSEARSFFESI